MIGHAQHGGSYSLELPPSHRILVDQQRDRIRNILDAIMVDRGLTLKTLVLVVVADLGGAVGKGLAGMYHGVGEVREELHAASLCGRRPVFIEGLVGSTAMEWILGLVPGALPYVAQRREGFFVVLVIDHNDRPVVTMARPMAPHLQFMN